MTDAEVLICKASDGKKHLHDIVGIKENAPDTFDLTVRETRRGGYEAATRGNASTIKVAKASASVKEKSCKQKEPSPQ